jgi:hypothetical protein
VIAMIRTLLAFSLLLSAAGAFAAEPEPSATDAPGCPKAEQAQDKAPPEDASKAASHPGTPAPVRPRNASTSRGTPRWHSLLPGMFR